MHFCLYDPRSGYPKYLTDDWTCHSEAIALGTKEYLTISIISSVYYLICNTQTTATQCKILGSGGNPNILHFPNYYSINFMVHLLYFSK